MPADKIRITLDLSADFYKRLEGLEEKVDAESKAHVIRESLRLYEYLVNQHLEGCEFFVRNKDGKEKDILLLGPPPVQ